MPAVLKCSMSHLYCAGPHRRVLLQLLSTDAHWYGVSMMSWVCCCLQETIWRQLPPLAQALGKREFKRQLEPFIDPLFRCGIEHGPLHGPGTWQQPSGRIGCRCQRLSICSSGLAIEGGHPSWHC